MELAERHLTNFPDGVWFIDLAPISSPDQIADAVAKPFDISGSAERSTLEVLIDYLRKLRTLVVLDNCEHLIQDVASVAREMLELIPGLRILATSREARNTGRTQLSGAAAAFTRWGGRARDRRLGRLVWRSRQGRLSSVRNRTGQSPGCG